MAVLLRLSEEDRAKYPGGDEEGWVRFDEKALDDLDFVTLDGFESGLGFSLEWILRIDKITQSVKWTAARVWLARKMAGLDTPPLDKFNIKVRQVEIREEKPTKARRQKAADDAAPLSSSPSSGADQSETASA